MKALDVVGVGFGPSNVALAVALGEVGAGPVGGKGLSCGFVEAQSRFGWHGGMLLDDATMQVSFLKDLVTPRNPMSPYSFVAYLHKRGRLSQFIDGKSWYPFRIEFHDYLEWVAGFFSEWVDYGVRVTAVRPVLVGGVVDAVDVVGVDAAGTESVRRARSLVVARGLRPRMPEGILESERVWHTSRLVSEVERAAGVGARSFVVLGAGQSAAEATQHLHRRFPDASVTVVHARYGFSVSDDSPFANGVFGANAVDEFFEAPAPVKQMILDYHANTNYSVVDGDLIARLHNEVYLESLTGRRRLRFLNLSRVVGVEPGTAGVRIDVQSLSRGDRVILDADFLVCATGYQPADPVDLLGELLPYCVMDTAGRVVLDRDRRVVTDDRVRCGVYVQGYGEHSHGIAESLLSLVAVRAGELADVLTKTLAG